MATKVNSGPYAVHGYVLVTDDGAGASASATYLIERKHPDDAAYVEVAAYSGPNGFSHKDYLAPANYAALYRVTRNDGVVSFQDFHTVHPKADKYWLVHPTNESLTFPLDHVTADSFDEEYAETVHQIIGRGRKADVGDNWGALGTLTCELRDTTEHTAAEQRRMLQAIRAERSYVYLRNPFGDVWKVSLGRIPFERVAGIGLREYLQVTIPYTEVR